MSMTMTGEAMSFHSGRPDAARRECFPRCPV